MKRNTLKLMLVGLSFVLLNISCSPSLSSLTTPSNLLGLLGNNSNLSSFAGLLNKVPAVGKLLGGKSPLTILAPSNDAIAGLGQETLNNLTSSKTGLTQLAGILKNHIIPGKVNLSDLAGGAVKSLGGNPINLGGAKAVGESVSADNGMIQVIDKVLQ